MKTQKDKTVVIYFNNVMIHVIEKYIIVMFQLGSFRTDQL